MNCFIYCRQSSGDDDFSESCDLQEQKLRELAKNNNIEVIDAFSDMNVSGKTYEEGAEKIASMDLAFEKWFKEQTHTKKFRHGLGQMMMRLSEVDYIFCWDITRLYRPYTGSFLESHINQMLVINDVKVWTLNDGVIDFSNFGNSLITALQNRINDQQIAIQKEKSKAAMKHLKQSGDWSGACFKSFGYRTTGRKREVEIDPIRGPLVVKIYEMFLNGCGYYIICKFVNRILTENGLKGMLYKTHMYRILRNPIYFGYYYENGELVKSKPNEGKELITFETWKAAQELLSRGKAIPKRDKKNWLPLRGKFECGYCGNKIGAVTYYSGVSMRCMRHAINGQPSCQNGLTWYTLEEKGTGILDALYPLTSIYFIDKLKNANSPETSKKIEEYEMKIIGIKNKMKKFKELYLNDIIDEKEFDRTIKSLQKAVEDYQKAVDAMKMLIRDNTYTSLKCLLDVSKCISHDLSLGEAETAFNYAIKNVIIFKDKITVQTVHGDFELPVKRIYRSKELPLITVIYPQEHLEDDFRVTLVYHFEEFNPNEDKFKIIAKLDNVIIGLF